ncbi:MAG: Crp/Fnr family transcriptional regulator [Acidovorax sp.]|jgi:CRP-like cAMP-binding protein|nr:Crp/Fnr family transcriptional regulator [Acidovorax sp.]
MLPQSFLDPRTPADVLPAGSLLCARNERATSVLHLDSGRVLLGVREGELLRHQLGTVEGPCWLDVAPALLGQPSVADLVADTTVQVRRVGRSELVRAVATLPQAVQDLVRDLAWSSYQQTELAVSRLAQDAEARCAQWLLRHAHHDGSGALRVTLHQRKRTIAAQLGIAPETFSRILRHLREHGLIAGTGNVLNLPQPRALEMVAAG